MLQPVYACFLGPIGPIVALLYVLVPRFLPRAAEWGDGVIKMRAIAMLIVVHFMICAKIASSQNENARPGQSTENRRVLLQRRFAGSGSSMRSRGTLVERSIGIRGVDLGAAWLRTLFLENK